MVACGAGMFVSSVVGSGVAAARRAGSVNMAWSERGGKMMALKTASGN